MVVPVLITNCHTSLNPKMGPVIAQIITDRKQATKNQALDTCLVATAAIWSKVPECLSVLSLCISKLYPKLDTKGNKLGYYVSVDLFYGIKVRSELPDPIDEYYDGRVFGRSTGCMATGDHRTEWLMIEQSGRTVLDNREITEPLVIGELKSHPEWDDMLLHYAQELGVQALTSPDWIVASSGG